MKFCTKCGKELHDEAIICPGCGCPATQIRNNTQSTQTHIAEPSQSAPSEKKPVPTFAIVLGIISTVIGSLSILILLFQLLTFFQIAPIVLSFIGFVLSIIGVIIGSVASDKNPNNTMSFTTQADKNGKSIMIPNKVKWNITNIGNLLSLIGAINIAVFIVMLTFTLS